MTRALANTLDVTVRIEQKSREKVYALGFTECLPEGWEFDGVVSDTKPGVVVVPEVGAKGPLEFAWIEVPVFPVSLTYQVYTAGVGGTILGQCLYRNTGAEQITLAALSSVSASGTVSSSFSQSLPVSVLPMPIGGGALRSVSDCDVHTADQSAEYEISLSELLRVIQFYNSDGFHCQSGTEDGYATGTGDESCDPHNSDYNPSGPDWTIDLTELLRLIQFFNSDGYRYDHEQASEDGYLAGKGEMPAAADTLSNSSIGLTCGVTPEIELVDGHDAYTLYVINDEATTCSDERSVDVTRQPMCVICQPNDYPIDLLADYAYKTYIPEEGSPYDTLRGWTTFCPIFTADHYVSVDFDDQSDGAIHITRITCTNNPYIEARNHDFNDK